MADYRYFAYAAARRIKRWNLIIESDDYNEVATMANWYDERVDVYFFDRKRMTFADYQRLADIKFDNAIARLANG